VGGGSAAAAAPRRRRDGGIALSCCVRRAAFTRLRLQLLPLLLRQWVRHCNTSQY